jgi:hypothetical protein
LPSRLKNYITSAIILYHNFQAATSHNDVFNKSMPCHAQQRRRRQFSQRPRRSFSGCITSINPARQNMTAPRSNQVSPAGYDLRQDPRASLTPSVRLSPEIPSRLPVVQDYKRSS